MNTITIKKKPSEIFKSGEMEWIQSKLYERNDQTIVGCCMIGAMEYAGLLVLPLVLPMSYMNISIDNRISQLADHIQSRLGYPGLAEWNDAPERTKEEVIAMLERFDL